mmetsp:Transcript_4561/g.9153  ORF Transcript_4561/g.9153 Transcript_4561/m.9153 type:complete len:214 (-) Transcript_4561:963-1604(-)
MSHNSSRKELCRLASLPAERGLYSFSLSVSLPSPLLFSPCGLSPLPSLPFFPLLEPTREHPPPRQRNSEEQTRNSENFKEKEMSKTSNIPCAIQKRAQNETREEGRNKRERHPSQFPSFFLPRFLPPIGILIDVIPLFVILRSPSFFSLFCMSPIHSSGTSAFFICRSLLPDLPLTNSHASFPFLLDRQTDRQTDGDAKKRAPLAPPAGRSNH